MWATVQTNRGRFAFPGIVIFQFLGISRKQKTSTPVTRVTATDADDPVYGNSAKLVYSILEGQPYFSVDPNTATIKIALHAMDREMREEYLVVIQAKDMGGHMGGLSGTTTVTVTLTDVNDNPPKFSKSLYEFVIPEDLPIGKMGGKVKANDRDIGDNAKSTYNIIEGDEQGMFEIVTDGQTQEGILRLKKVIDFESKRAYTLKVEATNIRSEPSNGVPFKDTATVKIVVEDSDEPPVFLKAVYLLEVNENAPINTVIGSVTARDPDSSASTVSRTRLNRSESKPLGGGRSGGRTFQGLSPRFHVRLSEFDWDPLSLRERGCSQVVCCCLPVLKVLCVCRAGEKREGEMGGWQHWRVPANRSALIGMSGSAARPRVRREGYFIDRHTDLERQFNINVDDGKITLAKPLDRETDMWHNITVTATEVRNHSQISRAIVAIRVMDINDNAPEFATEYEAFLCENGKPGQVIQTVSAVDKDDPIQGHYFDYRLVPEMLNNPNFTIKNNQ
ncbi:Cadherin-8, partial [Dissostichus eleginoides]